MQINADTESRGKVHFSSLAEKGKFSVKEVGKLFVNQSVAYLNWGGKTPLSTLVTFILLACPGKWSKMAFICLLNKKKKVKSRYLQYLKIV